MCWVSVKSTVRGIYLYKGKVLRKEEPTLERASAIPNGSEAFKETIKKIHFAAFMQRTGKSLIVQPKGS